MFHTVSKILDAHLPSGRQCSPSSAPEFSQSASVRHSGGLSPPPDPPVPALPPAPPCPLPPPPPAPASPPCPPAALPPCPAFPPWPAAPPPLPPTPVSCCPASCSGLASSEPQPIATAPTNSPTATSQGVRMLFTFVLPLIMSVSTYPETTSLYVSAKRMLPSVAALFCTAAQFGTMSRPM